MPRADKAFGIYSLKKPIDAARFVAYHRYKATPMGRLEHFLDILYLEHTVRYARGIPRRAERVTLLGEPDEEKRKR